MKPTSSVSNILHSRYRIKMVLTRNIASFMTLPIWIQLMWTSVFKSTTTIAQGKTVIYEHIIQLSMLYLK